MSTISLAFKSLLNRRFTAILTLVSIALSVSLLLGVERLRVESRNSFANTISGTDLVVGARSGAINLLLYSVFRSIRSITPYWDTRWPKNSPTR